MVQKNHENYMFWFWPQVYTAVSDMERELLFQGCSFHKKTIGTVRYYHQ